MPNKTFGFVNDIESVRALMDSQKKYFDENKIYSMQHGADLMSERIKRYEIRWREALAYVKQKSLILDIGSGWMPPDIYQVLIKEADINYHAIDIDEKTISEMKLLMEHLPPTNFQVGENGDLPYPKKFDMVFSSHCLEHAIDISKSLIEIHRVLVQDGHLFMSVPLGFDLSDEHTLYLGPDEWEEVLKSCGFDVITKTLGVIYDQCGDLTILARRSDRQPDYAAAHEVASRFSKQGSQFANYSSLVFSKKPQIGSSEAILSGTGESFLINQAARSLIVIRHPWSGMILIEGNDKRVAIDCYSPITYKCAIDILDLGTDIKVTIVGKNYLSLSDECCVVGVIV